MKEMQKQVASFELQRLKQSFHSNMSPLSEEEDLPEGEISPENNQFFLEQDNTCEFPSAMQDVVEPDK